MSGWNLKCILFVLTFITLFNEYLTGHVSKKNKNIAVKDISRKIYNLASKSLLNATPEKKEKILESIQTKLFKSASALGTNANKYIKLIMKGIKLMALSNTTTTNSEDKELGDAIASLRNGKNYTSSTPNQQLVKKIATKIFQLAQKQFRRAKTYEEKQKIIENIKRKVMESAKQKDDLLHAKHEEIKTYTELITRGMELMMDKITQKQRRMIMEFVNIPSNKGDENMERSYKELEQRTNFLDSSDEDKFKKLEIDTERPTQIPSVTPYLTTPFSCDEMFSQTCNDLRALSSFTCSDNGITLPLNKLCDGVTDCSDGSDEQHCVDEAIKRLHRATDIMSRIEVYLLRKCFLSEDNSLLIKQNNVLYEVLQKQIGFINKYKDINHNDDFVNVFAYKQTLNEAIIVIKTLSISLRSSLCHRQAIKRNAEVMARKYVPEMLDESLVTAPTNHFPVKKCNCTESYCTNLPCPEMCKRVCWHKFNLGHWSCQAVDEANTVSLDMVCDGKLDCYDETDEIGCSSGASHSRFEANDVFKNVVDMVHARSISKEYAAVKTKLVSLLSCIKQLHMDSSRAKVDVVSVRSTRDKCFGLLSSTYDDILEQDPSVTHLEDAQFFLLNVNEQLMIALKYSHTGNDRIISPDGCYCRDGKCALVQCTKGCTRACSVEPQLTKYSCKGSGNNNVTVEKLCNGKANCPFQDDEIGCSKEVCRKHHMVLLRHNIREVGENNRGSLVGEALRSWKTKVVSTLKIAENNYRPTPTTLRDIVNDILHDLVMTYASLEETRRKNGNAYREFFKVSQLVIGIVKSCGK